MERFKKQSKNSTTYVYFILLLWTDFLIIEMQDKSWLSVKRK